MPLVKPAWSLIVILVVICASQSLLLVRSNTDRGELRTRLSEQKTLAEKHEESFLGCMAKLRDLNQYIADQSLLSQKEATEATKGAEQTLDKLPEQIKSDKLVPAEPAQASRWMEGLFR